ncbi:MAG: glycosyltransferase [Marinoscillum sp.]
MKILANKAYIDEVVFLTIERSGDHSPVAPKIPKVSHQPLYSHNLKSGLLNKINDFRIFTRQITDILQKHNISQIMCRTSLAGSLGYLVSRKTKIPYHVESFEPHADYMLDGGVWSRWGFKYLFQKYWEARIIKTADTIVTVSRFFTNKIKPSAGGKVYTFGCAVDTEKFKFSEKRRIEIRSKLGIRSATTVGIYVGKFGVIYYDHEAFEIFNKAFNQISSFQLIILTPQDKSWVCNRLLEHGIDLSKCHVDKVAHEEVSSYLSASDFAFSMVRPSSVRLYCSPIKDGEYWANGLLVLSADGIGEDSDIIKSEEVGALFKDDLSDVGFAISKIKSGLGESRVNGTPQMVARKYRNFEMLHELYDQIFE